MVVDAEGHIVGRLASIVARLLLDGRRVVVVNVEKSLISGSRSSILAEQMKRLELKSVVNPKYTPRHPRAPDRIFSRMVRGMLPRRRPKGMEALKRLKVYVGVPEAYRPVEKRAFEEAKARRPLPLYTSLAEVSSAIGWRRD